MLVNLKRPPEDHSSPQRHSWIGFGLTGLVLLELAVIISYGAIAAPGPPNAQNSDLAMYNVEKIGMLLYTDYLIPFEVASMLLLVAMVGAIILAKREL